MKRWHILFARGGAEMFSNLDPNNYYTGRRGFHREPIRMDSAAPRNRLLTQSDWDAFHGIQPNPQTPPCRPKKKS